MKCSLLMSVSAVLIATRVSAEPAVITGVTRLEEVELALEQTFDHDGCLGAAVVDFPDIQFDLGSATLRSDAAVHLDTIAQVILRNGFDHFVIEGHTDTIGSNSYNLDLSRRRAEAVGAALRARGVSQDDLSLRWYGEERLRYPDQPEHPYNRRVTLLRVGLNSALYGAESGLSELSVKVMALPESGGDKAYVHEPTQPMQTGAWFFLCVAARADGKLIIEHRGAGARSFSALGAWRLPSGALARAPETGTLRVTGRPDVEELRLVHVSDSAACQVGSAARLERIELVDTRPQAVPTHAVSAPECTCGSPGVACSKITISHQ
jgi:outer membrane protein OmpA-like peptidoglycan-associated protein